MSKNCIIDVYLDTINKYGIIAMIKIFLTQHECFLVTFNIFMKPLTYLGNNKLWRLTWVKKSIFNFQIIFRKNNMGGCQLFGL